MHLWLGPLSAASLFSGGRRVHHGYGAVHLPLVVSELGAVSEFVGGLTIGVDVGGHNSVSNMSTVLKPRRRFRTAAPSAF